MEWFYDLMFYVFAAIHIVAAIAFAFILPFVALYYLFYNPDKDAGIWILTDATTAQRLEAPKATPARQSRCQCTKSEKG